MSKIKCVLIDPTSIAVNVAENERIKEIIEKHYAYPPVGLAYIGAFLRENGIEVKIIDAKSLHLSPQLVAQMVGQEEPQFVGITVFTTQLRGALITAKEIKKVHPSVKIIVGGPHIHSQHREMLNKDDIDFCVRGEGELTMLELINTSFRGKELRKVKGISFKESNSAVINPDRPFIQDLDILPFPARDLLPNHIYKGSIGGREPDIFTTMTATRGCPFRCHFCSVPQFWPTQRRRSIGNVLDELEHIYDCYKIRFIRFTGEILTLNKKWITEFCRGMVERGLNQEIIWSCDTRANIISEEVLTNMKKANCGVIFYGIEFGNQRILDFSGKKTTLSQVRRAIKMTKEAGIIPTGNFMIGYPTETKETIEDTIAFAKELDLEEASFSIVTPFPGTRLYDYCKENDLLELSNWEEYRYFHPKKGYIKLFGLSQDELMGLYQKAHLEFYYRDIKEDIIEELAKSYH